PKYQTLPYNTKFGPLKKGEHPSNVSTDGDSISSSYRKGNIGGSHDKSMVGGRDISVVINAAKGEESLEERPSPSGSSGSSDRISTSLASYTYNDNKLVLNRIASKNPYFSELE